jgi:hypothetical protein
VRFALWVAGRFSLTNEMLSNLRAAGFAHGRNIPRRRDHYSEEVAAIRLAVKGAAREQGLVPRPPQRFVVPEERRVDVRVVVLGHARHDPDAWYLLSKAAIDGLRDADVLSSDRFCVRWVSGTVVHVTEDECLVVNMAAEHGCDTFRWVRTRQGFFVTAEVV